VISRFFIDRPIFAAVLSILITLAGAIAYRSLAVAQYPSVTPPTVQVDCNYPGASATVVAQTVAAPIEQQVNGVEKMLYMQSQCTNDGSYNLQVTFEHGVDLNMAQVLVQNRVNLAIPMLPDVVKATGVTTRKRSPDILLAVALYSPDGTYDQLYLSNYALLRVKDEVARLPGVSDVSMLGQRDYSMRVWVNPDALAARNMTAGDVVRALREQNAQVAAGQIGQPPIRAGQLKQITLTTLGRLVDADQFENVVVKTAPDGRITRLKDVANVELSAKNQDVNCQIDGKPAVSLAVFQLPDANALDTAIVVKDKIAELAKDFPHGVDYKFRYDTTPYISESIWEVKKTLLEAVILVAVVVLVFLQNWRSAIIPLVAVPVAIIGTFAAMAVLGFSLNNLTLFGLVLAIGIVVDDAIVVVEAVEHHIEQGLAPRAATIKAMDQVSGPVIAVGLVLSAVFVPCAFISGITGQFFRQFALTIAVSTIISAFNSLTLSPALAALLLRPRVKGTDDVLPRLAFVVLGGFLGYLAPSDQLGPSLQTLIHTVLPAAAAQSSSALTGWAALGTAIVGGAILGWVLGKFLNLVLARAFWAFNAGFDYTTKIYLKVVGRLLRASVLALFFYGGLLVLTCLGFQGLPKSVQNNISIVNTEAQGTAWLGRKLNVSTDPRTFGDRVRKKLYEGATTIEESLRRVLKAFETGLPKGFIPSQDMGYLMINVQLPDSASLERTKQVMDKVERIACGSPGKDDGMPGVKNAMVVTGQSFLLSAFGSNLGSMFVILKDFSDRTEPELYGEKIAQKLRDRFTDEVPEAQVSVFPPPPVRGVGRAGGFKIMVEDRRGDLDIGMLQRQSDALTEAANQDSSLVGLVNVFRANAPQLKVDVDRKECMTLGVTLGDVFETLQVYLGSIYVNDFNRFGRTWQVIVQAAPKFRNEKEQVAKLKVRNQRGGMVPLGAVANIREVNGPLILTRYNMRPAAGINGNAAPGTSSGQAISTMERLAKKDLPPDMGFEWTEMAYLELLAGNTAMVIFGFSVVFVFLVLAAQYESWSLPLAVILVVPLCLLSSITGVAIAKMDINIFTQIGFVVLVGLASKNAILIVEFAKKKREAGVARREATLEACKLRLRPIVMTSIAFILGVVPLLITHGAGAEMRHTLGTAVFSGMLGVTLFGVFLTPVFFITIDKLSESKVFAAPLLRQMSSILLTILTLGLGRKGRPPIAQPARAVPIHTRAAEPVEQK
jgi:multidrug efflux pump